MKAESKYYPLYKYLCQIENERIRISFQEIEEILGASLPATARKKRSFWSNRGRGGIQAAAWMEGGYHVVDVDLEGEWVVFEKPVVRYTVHRKGEDVLWDGHMVRALRAHLGVNQVGLAEILGVRQQTVSEWEKAVYTPTRSRSRHLTMIAEQRGFYLGGGKQVIEKRFKKGLDTPDVTV